MFLSDSKNSRVAELQIPIHYPKLSQEFQDRFSRHDRMETVYTDDRCNSVAMQQLYRSILYRCGLGIVSFYIAWSDGLMHSFRSLCTLVTHHLLNSA